MTKSQPLPLLLGLALMLYVAEGFAGMHRTLHTSKYESVSDVTIKMSPQSLRRNHLPVASSLCATLESQTSKTMTTSDSGSQKVQEMASFLCVRLVQTVMTKSLTEEGGSMDLEALETLTAALQGSKKSKDNDDKSASALSSTADIDSIEETKSDDIQAPEPKLDDAEETKIESLATENELPEAAPLSLDTPEGEEYITSDLVDEGWDPYDDHPDDFSAQKEEEADIYPEGSLPLPRAETPTYIVSPLEVVESNVVPLRPSSIPQKKTPTLVTEDEGMKVTAVAKEEEQGTPLEMVAELKEEKIESFIEKETDTIFDASKAWELGEILATTTDGVGTTTSPIQAKSEELVDTTQVSAVLQAEELFRRSLLQRRFKMEAMTKSVDYSKEDNDSLSKIKLVSPDKRVIEQVECNAAGERRDAGEEAAAIAASKVLQQKNEDLFRRKLLALQFELVAKEASFESQEKEMLQKKSDALFQQRLLAAKLDYDSKTLEANSKALEVEKKKNDYLFQRKLLEKSFQYEASRIQKELIEKSRSRKKFEFATKAIEIIQQEIEESKTDENVCTSKNENTPDEIAPSPVLDERSDEDSQRKEPQPNETEEIPSPDLVENVEENSIENPLEEKTETIQTGTQLSDDVVTSDERDDDPRGDSSYQIAGDDFVSSLPTVTQERYAKEIEISRSFQFREYNPTTWSTNNHFQTIVGTLYRKEAMYSRGSLEDFGILLDILGVEKMSDEARKPLDEFEWDQRYRVETKDGDYYIADWKYAKTRQSGEDENPVCLICHGLESCSDSEIVREIAIACNENNMDAACLNFRGCHDSGESCNLTPRGYHLGFTDDLMQQIEEVHEKNPNRRIYLSGFSLGAGVVTRLLTQLGPKASEYNICGAAVNAVPFDVMQNYMALNGPGFTRSVYGERLLKSMKIRMAKQYDQGGFTFDKSEIEKCQTIMDIENLAICPVFGFDDAYDYYKRVKTIDKLQQVCVPQYVIQARDDPFFVGLEELADDDSIPLRIQYTDYGGHCGYILHQRESDEMNCKTSWMPRQLARFLAHIEEERGSDN